MRDMLDDIPDDGLRDRLRHYTEMPDDRIWEKISPGFKDANTSLREQLQNYTDNPDESAWDKITAGLIRHRNLLWIQRAGQVAAFAALLFLFYPMLPYDRSTMSQTSGQSGKPIDEDAISSGMQMSSKPQSKLADTVMHAQPRIATLPSENNSTSSHMVNGTLIMGIDTCSVQTRNHLSDFSIADATINHRTIDQEVPGPNDTLPVSIALQGEDNQAITVTPVPHEAQEQKESNASRVKGLYVLVMPTFGYQKISPLTNDNLLIESIKKVSAFSADRLGLRAEIGHERLITNRLAFNVALVYFQRKQTITYDFTDGEHFEVTPVSEDSLLYQVISQQQTGSFEYELKNLGISGGVNYSVKGKHFAQRVGLAAELHRSLMQANAEVAHDTGFNFFGNVYYRLSYPLSRRFDAMLQPTFNFALQLDERINAPFYVKPYGLGLNFGVYFHF